MSTLLSFSPYSSLLLLLQLIYLNLNNLYPIVTGDGFTTKAYIFVYAKDSLLTLAFCSLYVWETQSKKKFKYLVRMVWRIVRENTTEKLLADNQLLLYAQFQQVFLINSLHSTTFFFIFLTSIKKKKTRHLPPPWISQYNTVFIRISRIHQEKKLRIFHAIFTWHFSQIPVFINLTSVFLIQFFLKFNQKHFSV